MKKTVTPIPTLKLTVEYIATNSSGRQYPVTFSSKFSTAVNAAKWYAKASCENRWRHLSYTPNRQWEEKIYPRVLKVFQKYLP